MAKVSISATTRSIYLRSEPPYQGSMTVWALRDLIRVLNEHQIPDNATVNAEHNHSTTHLVALNVRHIVEVAPAPGEAPGPPQPTESQEHP